MAKLPWATAAGAMADSIDKLHDKLTDVFAKDEDLSELLQTHVGEEDHDRVAFVNASWFFRFINLVILLNSIQLGLCADKDENIELCEVSSVIFTFVFAVEMILKIIAQHWEYFHSYWNLIDFGLMGLGVVDIVFLFPGVSCSLCGEFSILRLMRLTRTLRLFRVLRTSRHLAVLAEGFVHSLRAMVWVGVLLAVLVYAGGIFAFGAFGDLKKNGEVDWDIGFFDTLGDSMLTLFDVSILDLWGDMVRPLVKVHPWSFLFFAAYVFVSSFGILNLMIGIITESTAKAALEFEKRRELANKALKMRCIRDGAEKLFISADRNQDDRLSEEELVQADKTELFELLKKTTLPPGFKVKDLHMMCSPHERMEKGDFIDAMRRIVFCNQFERDCIFQHSINDLRRQFAHLRAYLSNMNGQMDILINTASETYLGKSSTDHLSSYVEETDNQCSNEPKVVTQIESEHIQTSWPDAAAADPDKGPSATQTGEPPMNRSDMMRLIDDFHALGEKLKTEIRHMGQNLQLHLYKQQNEERNNKLNQKDLYDDLQPAIGLGFTFEADVESAKTFDIRESARSSKASSLAGVSQYGRSIQRSNGTSAHADLAQQDQLSRSQVKKPSGLFSALKYGGESVALGSRQMSREVASRDEDGSYTMRSQTRLRPDDDGQQKRLGSRPTDVRV